MEDESHVKKNMSQASKRGEKEELLKAGEFSRLM